MKGLVADPIGLPIILSIAKTLDSPPLTVDMTLNDPWYLVKDQCFEIN